MKIAYCGHSYHQTTKSTEFLESALRGLGQVDSYWDEEWLTKAPLNIEPILDGRYDAVVVLQLVSVARRLAAAQAPNVTLFPMYDGCAFEPDSAWRNLTPIKIVSFSSTLHERLQRLGLLTRHVAYAVDPAHYSTVDHGVGLAGYFWQRKQEITWRTVRPLIEGSLFQPFTLHLAIDPGDGEPALPTPEEEARFHVRKTKWHASREDARADLMRHSVYFAPRLREGIGMSFLEAMAMGMLVVAPAQPTMNEYIVSGVNGFLYDPDRPLPLDYSERAIMGARARESIERGWDCWRRSRDPMLDFVLAPPAHASRKAPFRSFDPLALQPSRPLAARPPAVASTAREGGRRLRTRSDAARPEVTVTVVVADAGEALASTLDSVLAQDHPSREIVVLAGPSRDAAPDVIRSRDGELDYWHIRRGRGPCDVMNEAARLACGRFTLFLNAGDRLLTSDSLSRAFDSAPGDADVIYGHHVSRDALGFEDLHRAADFRETWRRLRAGEMDWGWQIGVPCGRATLLRTETLRQNPFRIDPRLGGHLELLCRLACGGARFHHSMATIAAGSLSFRERRRQLDASRRIALEYTSDAERARKAFADMRQELARAELPHLTAWQLVTRVGRVPGATRALKRRLRAIPWHRLTGAERREVRFGDDRPYGLVSATGLSSPEGWGCWTDGPRVSIELEPALMASATRLVVDIQQVFGPNVGRPLVLRVGSQRHEHVLRQGRQQLRLASDALARVDRPRIELEIPCPSSPHDLGGGDDVRKLGVALERMVIEARRAR